MYDEDLDDFQHVGDLVLADSWEADELEVPELYDTDHYDGYDEDFFG